MANLETLELTIKSNADSASQGLTSLINSLNALHTAVSNNITPLKRLNDELSKMKQYSGIKLPNFSGATGDNASKAVNSAKRVTKSVQAQADAIKAWQEARKPLTISHFRDNIWTEEQEKAANPQWFNNYDDKKWQAKAEESRALEEKNHQIEQSFNETSGNASGLSNSLKNVAQAAEIPVSKIDALKMKLEGLDVAMDKASKKGDLLGVANKRLSQFSTYDKIEKETAALQKQSTEVEKTATVTSKLQDAFKGLGKAVGRVGRIFSTMLIRTALKSLMKAFSESWSAAYQFSKAMGGDFAQSVEKAKTLMSGMATNIISAFSPAISALVPVLQAVSNAVMYLCNAIKSLFSMLGMSSDLFGASTDAINSYSKAAGGGGKANKEMLASFDELNVISQESGGGGGGGSSYVKGMFSDIISDEMAKIQLIVSESLLALGLILACTGHIPIGVALMAVGAAGIAKTVFEDWGKLSTEVQGQLTNLMAIIGGATLVIGAILAFSGANIPLGIGLMAIGGVNLGAAIGLNWDSMVSTIQYALNNVELIFTNMWSLIVAAADAAWTAISVWWEATGIGTFFRNAWGGISSFFKGLWETVSELAHSAWVAVGIWWKTKVLTNISKVWDAITSFFSGLWEGISTAASNAWDNVKKWWESTGIVEGAKRIWNEIGNFLQNTIWKPISRTVEAAWNWVKKWWEDSGIGTKVRGVWSAIVDFLKNEVWSPIQTAIINAWNTVTQWWENTGIGTWVRETWQGVLDVFNNLKAIVDSIVQGIRDITGEHYVKIIQEIQTKGTTANNAATVAQAALETQGWMGKLASTVVGWFMPKKEAAGEYGIPKGEIFVAQEAGAELIGEINGKTSVANQGQIIEGISSGVERANAEQNVLLRQQNDLLRGILEKEMNVSIGASANFGRTAKRSIEMYNAVAGG